MAYTITGKILVIGNIESIPYQDKVFRKRELVLDASRFNSMTGEQYQNYPKFEVGGNHVDELNNYHIDQMVTVTFAISGRRSEKNGQVGYFTNLQAYKIEPYQRYNNQSQGNIQSAQIGHSNQSTVYGSQAIPPHNNVTSQQPPMQAEQFPPALNQSYNPVSQDKVDLPF